MIIEQSPIKKHSDFFEITTDKTDKYFIKKDKYLWTFKENIFLKHYALRYFLF